jgi:hypothetical protein
MLTNRSEFGSLLIEARHATVALDGVRKKDSRKVIAGAVSGGKRIYSQLLDYQRAAWMTLPEAVSVQNSLDLLRAQLRFFDEDV